MVAGAQLRMKTRFPISDCSFSFLFAGRTLGFLAAQKHESLVQAPSDNDKERREGTKVQEDRHRKEGLEGQPSKKKYISIFGDIHEARKVQPTTLKAVEEDQQLGTMTCRYIDWRRGRRCRSNRLWGSGGGSD